ncbi:MAG TPA: hypothetical protein VGI10_19390 [Polyangiaceae bacterium]|jgi:hypothetical protein
MPAAAGTNFVSLRPSGIAFSAAFIRHAGFTKRRRVSLLIDEKHQRLGFQFHDRQDDSDAYAATGDGGGATDARWIQVKTIYDKYAWPEWERLLPL